MKYKLIPKISDKFKINQILDMLRYCNGILLTIKSKNRVKNKLIHNVNFKLLECELNKGVNGKTLDRFYFNTCNYYLGDIKNIEYIVVESDYICEKRWNSFGYIVEKYN